MKKKILAIVFAVLFVAIPVFAVFNEKDLAQTLSVLRYELNQEYVKLGSRQGLLDSRNTSQHQQITEMLKKCNELSLILYSQNQDFTFDMTYALNEVTEEYEAFKKKRMPYDDMLARLDLEIEKYENLIKSLKRLPPRVRDSAETGAPVAFFSDSLKAVTDSIREEMIQTAGMDSLIPGTFPMGMRRDSLRLALKDTSAVGPRDTAKRASGLFILDEQGRADRDSCIIYAETLLNMYRAAKIRTLVDNEYYENASARLEESYQYAQARYRDIQKKIFIDGQDNYWTVITTLPDYSRKAWREAWQKYNTTFDIDDQNVVSHSEWRGPMVFGFIVIVIIHIILSVLLSALIFYIYRRRISEDKRKLYGDKMKYSMLFFGYLIFALSLMVARITLSHNFFGVATRLLLIFAWLLVAIVGSHLVRSKTDMMKAGMRLYTPVVLLGLIVITLRIIFIPNSMVNLILPPTLIIFLIWQWVVCSKSRDKIEQSDRIMSLISLFVIIAATVVSLCGYVLMAMTAIMWWLFQLAAAETLLALYIWLNKHYKSNIDSKISELRKNKRSDFSNTNRGFYIRMTWLYDLFEMVFIPVAAILSVPLSIYFAAGIFDFGDICKDLFFKPFFDLTDSSGNIILHLTTFKIVLVASLFFIFKYVAYAIKAFYRYFRFQQMRRVSGQDYIRANQVNLTLANNVISILVWGTYIILCIVLLKIPMGAISIVAAGLATGIGLALKDVLNNFIYGIQLMSGRLRVGDYIECDGVRGRVERISYQSTQIETLEGVVMAFTNTTLFNKNFMNLTRNNAYEFIKVVVGVKYGSDVEQTRQVLVEAMEPLCTKDKFGRDVVNPEKGIYVTFDSFGDSSINLAVKQYVLVEEEIGYVAKAKERIYNALNEAKIEIPFPQRDVYVKISHE